MKQSFLFTKTRREAPSDEVAKNAILLIRAGFIHKEMAGVYSYLPLGLRVIEKINRIIREEMNSLGAIEFHLTALQSKDIWQKTGRWDEKIVDSWFKTTLRGGGELGLAFTHEEPLTNLMKDHIRSWKDLPVYVYQIQTKFRNESRAKSGILRGREFLMKDLYSFSKDDKEHELFYDKAKEAYARIFERIGIGEKTRLTFASGGSFSKYSHEFQTITDAGEDTIHVCANCDAAVNEEIFSDHPSCPKCGGKNFKKEKAVEVGNIFSLGTKFSQALDLVYLDEEGKRKEAVMGSYGIGPGRLMGTVVEVQSDDKGIVWPASISPFEVHLLDLSGSDPDLKKESEKLYQQLLSSGLEVLYDDRDLRAGEKFTDADLIGIPWHIVIGKKAKEGKAEIKDRKTGKSEDLSLQDVLATLKEKCRIDRL